MKHTNYFWIFALLITTSTSWAYGGGGSGSTKACAKPKFTDFVPGENAEVKAGSTFSFTASKNTYSNTIKVSVKEQPVNIKVVANNDGSFQVSGTIPPALKPAHARIAINADAPSNCKGTGGWLVKIAE